MSGLPPGLIGPGASPSLAGTSAGRSDGSAAPQYPAGPAKPTGAGQPAPRPPGPYAGPLSNPLLSPSPSSSSSPSTASPQPTPATREKIARYIAKLIEPETTLDLIVGQTRVLVLKDVPFRIQTGDEQTVSFNLASPREVLLQGKDVGATVLTLWFGDKNDPVKQETLTYLVRVFPDPEAKERLERAYKALEDDINKHFRDSSVRLKVLGDKLVVTGRVRDFVQGNQILQIIRAISDDGRSGSGNGGDVRRLPLVPAGFVDPNALTTPPSPEAFQNAGGPNVINLLEVAGEQQVILRVIVAEVNRAAARSVGMNFAVRDNRGQVVFVNATGVGSGGNDPGFDGGLGGGSVNLFARFDSGKVPVAISALKTLQYAKSMAEPTLATLNGQTANMLVGGQFPVPIIAAGGFGGGVGGFSNLQGVSYVPYGVQLSFTPFITDRDRIRLVLSANVSTRDLNSAAIIGGANVAGLNTRNVNTTVELRQGETLAVAGLIEANIGGDRNGLPFLSEIPGLNLLTGLQRVQASEKELVIFVTPELTRPLDVGATPALPGAEILDPNDVEFYLLGRLEGHCKDFRSPIRNDCSRIKQYARTEMLNLVGPTGYTPLP